MQSAIPANVVHAMAAVCDQAFIETICMNMSFEQQYIFAIENGYATDHYELVWLDESGQEHWLGFYAINDATAISAVRHKFRGCEGLVSCVTVAGDSGELSFDLF